MGYLRSIVFKFMMFWSKGECLAYNLTNLFNLSIIFFSFFITFRTWLGLSHPSIAGIFQCVCTHVIDPMSIHFLCCAHDNEHTRTYDAIRNTFVATTQDANFHMGQKQLHVILSTTFNSSHQWVDIVFTKGAICTLINIVIVNPTQIDLFPRSCTTQGLVASNATRAKEKNYCNQHLTDIPFFNNWTIWLFTQTCRCVFTWLCHCHLELERARGPSSFYLGHFSLSKNFDHITKDASVFHFELGGNYRFNYFPTSTLSKHTSHHHSRSIVDCWFLT
jgi:hypothetical protein